ncbi:hypothetical protein ACNRWW_06325 [Metabacillus sp. HB246100]|uniref:hypothetical protein n=1 Tax=Bacillus weihaiensis TaxID=1547283 RepID=UPI0023555BA0|nr:hypothetical protein [Bacillus weihaiensis]
MTKAMVSVIVGAIKSMIVRLTLKSMIMMTKNITINTTTIIRNIKNIIMDIEVNMIGKNLRSVIAVTNTSKSI